MFWKKEKDTKRDLYNEIHELSVELLSVKKKITCQQKKIDKLELEKEKWQILFTLLNNGECTTVARIGGGLCHSPFCNACLLRKKLNVIETKLKETK